MDGIAQIDILTTHNYIYYNLNNPIAAKFYMENIINKIESLKHFPYRGVIYLDIFHRFLIYKNYLIFYEIQEKEKLIVIKRIIHKNINNNDFINVY